MVIPRASFASKYTGLQALPYFHPSSQKKIGLVKRAVMGMGIFSLDIPAKQEPFKSVAICKYPICATKSLAANLMVSTSCPIVALPISVLIVSVLSTLCLSIAFINQGKTFWDDSILKLKKKYKEQRDKPCPPAPSFSSGQAFVPSFVTWYASVPCLLNTGFCCFSTISHNKCQLCVNSLEVKTSQCKNRF